MFTLDTFLDSSAYCRNLAPLYGINEESATGTSNGALACYLLKYGGINNGQKGHFVMEQGYAMDQPSEILVDVKVEGNDVVSVNVGGNALDLTEIEVER